MAASMKLPPAITASAYSAACVGSCAAQQYQRVYPRRLEVGREPSIATQRAGAGLSLEPARSRATASDTVRATIDPPTATSRRRATVRQLLRAAASASARDEYANARSPNTRRAAEIAHPMAARRALEGSGWCPPERGRPRPPASGRPAARWCDPAVNVHQPTPQYFAASFVVSLVALSCSSTSR
jgi:hypothetical protein